MQSIIAKEGKPFIGVAALLFLFALLLDLNAILTWILFGGLVFTVAFFRDPNRLCPGGQNEILSPADGRIVSVQHVENDRFLGGPAVKVDIFMSPFNVHVNRAPLAGIVKALHYNPGRFFNAASEKASLENEQNAMTLLLDDGRRIVVNQIAGFVARRIVCRVRVGRYLERGERFGMIRFGSRVDLHLPPKTRLFCRMGERVYAGDTILGVLDHG